LDARVIDQDVQVGEVPWRPTEQGASLLSIGDIAPDSVHFRQSGFHVIQFVLSSAANDNFIACFQEGFGQGETDSRSPAQ